MQKIPVIDGIGSSDLVPVALALALRLISIQTMDVLYTCLLGSQDDVRLEVHAAVSFCRETFGRLLLQTDEDEASDACRRDVFYVASFSSGIEAF